MANSAFTKSQISTPVSIANGGTGASSSADARKELGFAKAMTAGETLNGAITPIPVYLKDVDNEVYACDADVVSQRDFIGFAYTNGTDGNGINVQFDGIIAGFAGLTKGAEYFVQDTAGTIGTTPSSSKGISVGVAVSATEIKIETGGASAVSATDVVDGGSA